MSEIREGHVYLLVATMCANPMHRSWAEATVHISPRAPKDVEVH